jgi:4-amino-4-deoxy-L-arabinose transferase-like glycosyltransferase
MLIFLVTTIPISDSKYYIDNSNLLFETGSYINSYGNLSAFWTVGLPAYLVVLKYYSPDFILTAKLLNILISLSLILCCYFIFKNYLNNKALNVFLILITFFPNSLFSSNIILTDYPFTALLWASILLLFLIVKKPSICLAVLIGITFAIAAYLRPIAIVLTIILTAILFFKNYPLLVKYSAIILSVFTMLHLPWVIRNYNLFHSIVPVSTNGGYIFLMGNHSESNGGVNFNFKYDLSNPNEAEESSKAYQKALDDIIDNPVKSCLRLPLKLIHTYYRGDSSITWALKNTKEKIPAFIISFVFYLTNLIFYIIILMNIYVLWLKRREINIRKYLELIAVSAYVFLILVIFVGSERYHIPLLPIHIFLAAKYFELK